MALLELGAFFRREALLEDAGHLATEVTNLRDAPGRYGQFLATARAWLFGTFLLFFIGRFHVGILDKQPGRLADDVFVELSRQGRQEMRGDQVQMAATNRGGTKMRAVVIAGAHGPLETLAGDAHPPNAAEDGGLLHIHVITVETGGAMRNENVEIEEVMVSHGGLPVV